MERLTCDLIFSEGNIKYGLSHTKPPRNRRTPDCRKQWATEGEDILWRIRTGEYKPQPCQRIYISKKGGDGQRMLTIPVEQDRLIQSVMSAGMNQYFEEFFHDASFAFRKGRGVGDALGRCCFLMNQGKTVVVNMDIEKFFDNVEHAVLMRIVKPHVADWALLLQIHRVCKCPVVNRVEQGSRKGKKVWRWRYEKRSRGLCQGSPLSPVLANVVLNELDWYLDGEGIEFVRYADDILLFAETMDDAVRYMDVAETFLREKLELKLNRKKTAVVRADKLVFLGYCFFRSENGQFLLDVAKEAAERVCNRTSRALHKYARGSREFWNYLGAYNRGIMNYFEDGQMETTRKLAKVIDGKEWEYAEMERDNTYRKQTGKNDMLASGYTSAEVWNQHLEEKRKFG